MTFANKPSSKLSVSQLQLSFTSVLKLILIVYIASSLIYTALHFYNARPSSNTLPPLQPENHPSFLQDANAHADLWNGQTVFWTNDREKEGAEHSFPVDYVISKVFSGGMMPSKILPYFYKSSPPASTEDVTITTLVTEDRLLILEQMVRRYRGPVSACMHVSDDEKGTGILNKLHRLMEKPLMKKYVDVHLILDNYERQFNLWRNIARFFARTEFIMMLDVDFFLCTDIRTSILGNPEHVAMLRRNNTAFVVPAFEYSNLERGLDANTFPRRKSDLLPQYFSEDLVMFHRSWVRGHNATDYEKWTAADQVYEVTDYSYSYEPYVIIRKDGAAWCDERFIGYGSNKAACLFEIYLSGVDFWVLPDDFLIHQTHMYPEEARKQERTYNKKLYQNFREEACYKYSRMLMGTGEWESPTAHNVMTECSKIPGFQKAVAEFV